MYEDAYKITHLTPLIIPFEGNVISTSKTIPSLEDNYM
jgi:hypothetical protein